jgi:predicted CoA-binding protein
MDSPRENRATGSVVEETIKEILESHKTVAVVGLSRNPAKDSYIVAKYLQDRGYRIVPVNPVAEKILGEKSHKSLLELPEGLKKSVEIVDIFRPPEAVPPIVDETIKLREAYGLLHVVWMQLGIVHEEAAEKARGAGMTVVMDRCIMVDHQRFLSG